MEILYIEDELSKANNVIQLLRNEFEVVSIKHVKSFNNGVEKLRNSTFQLVLLDMSLPIYDSSIVGSYDNEF